MIHILTGNGKGKTTSAIGQAIRTAGYGKKVLFVQFIKDMEYSEINVLKNIYNIEYYRFGNGCFISREPNKADYQIVKQGIEQIIHLVENNDYMLIVLDELNIALHYKLLDLEEIRDLLLKFKDNLERDLVITGRYAPSRLIQLADLVTEFQEVKHYYRQGVLARDGIER
jgi:cob(I)alamin adenosyltransferase